MFLILGLKGTETFVCFTYVQTEEWKKKLAKKQKNSARCRKKTTIKEKAIHTHSQINTYITKYRAGGKPEATRDAGTGLNIYPSSLERQTRCINIFKTHKLLGSF